jgi:hypothetical protein
MKMSYNLIENFGSIHNITTFIETLQADNCLLVILNESFQINLTKISSVVIVRALESRFFEHLDHPLRGPRVEAIPFRDKVEVVEHLEDAGARLVDDADDGVPSGAQVAEVRDHLDRRRAVQATERRETLLLFIHTSKKLSLTLCYVRRGLAALKSA